MGTCRTCGNNYDKSFDVLMDGVSYTFDSFECAINELAPQCNHCGCRIIGHGLESDAAFFCCANCAKQAGATDLQDRV